MLRTQPSRTPQVAQAQAILESSAGLNSGIKGTASWAILRSSPCIPKILAKKGWQFSENAGEKQIKLSKLM